MSVGETTQMSSTEKVEPEAELTKNESDSLYIDPVKEKKLVRKLDFFIIPIVSIIFCLSYIDRGNIGNALSNGLAEDLGLHGGQTNTAVIVFYAGYIALQVPAPVVMKKLRPSRMIPGLLAAWGFAILGNGFISNFSALVGLRVFLGLCESGIYPCLALLLSNFYLRREQAQRISYLQISQAISGAFGGLLAAGLFNMDGLQGHSGWQWLYIIEGVITITFSLPCFYFLPDNYKQAHWLNAEEKELMRRREANSIIYAGKEEFTWYEVRRAFLSPRTYISAIGQFCCNVCSFGFSTFLPVIIRGFGYGAIETQLLTVPVYVTATLLYIGTAMLSDRIGRRTVFMVPLTILTAIGYALELPDKTATGVKFFGCFMIGLGIWSNVGLNVTILSNTNAGHYKRATAIGIQQTIGNSAGFVGGSIYRTRDAPRYRLGHSVSLGAILIAGSIYTVQAATLMYLNRSREKLSEEERKRMLEKNYDGDRHPDFRFIW